MHQIWKCGFLQTLEENSEIIHTGCVYISITIFKENKRMFPLLLQQKNITNSAITLGDAFNLNKNILGQNVWSKIMVQMPFEIAWSVRILYEGH